MNNLCGVLLHMGLLKKNIITISTKSHFEIHQSGFPISDGRTIKASYNGGNPEDRNDFIHSRCLMPISIGQKVHEGQKFEATLNLVNRTFKSCTILIDDTVQRHTLAISSPEICLEDLKEFCELEGKKWLERNNQYIRQLEIPVKIISWDYFLKHKNFSNQLQCVSKLYDDNSTFKGAINRTIEAFIKRYFARQELVEQETLIRSYRCCLNYLLEECAVMSLWPELDCQFELYPTGRNEAMCATYDLLISPKHKKSLRSVALRFKKYGSVTQIKHNLCESVIA